MSDETTIEPEAADEASDAETPPTPRLSAPASPTSGPAAKRCRADPRPRPAVPMSRSSMRTPCSTPVRTNEERYISPFDRPGKWFVLHTQSGYEKKVKQNLEARIASMNMENRIHEVVIPTREVPEFKNGKKVMTEKKLFPGYLLCRTVLDDDAWYVIRNTPGVTGFVNQGGKPSPMRRKDVENFLGVEADRKQEQSKKSKPMFEYSMGETVRVKEGPFADFSGEIIEINEDQLKVKVLVNIFGRETPVSSNSPRSLGSERSPPRAVPSTFLRAPVGACTTGPDLWVRISR